MAKEPSTSKGKKIEKMKNKLENILNLMEKKLRSAEKKGIDVGESSELLSQAREALESNDIKRAKMLAARSKKKLVESIKAWKETDKDQSKEADEKKKDTEEEKAIETEAAEPEKSEQKEESSEITDDEEKEVEEEKDKDDEKEQSEEEAEESERVELIEEEETEEKGALAEIEGGAEAADAESEGDAGEETEEETEPVISLEIIAEDEVSASDAETEESESDEKTKVKEEEIIAQNKLKQEEERAAAFATLIWVKAILKESRSQLAMGEEKKIYTEAKNLYQQKEYSQVVDMVPKIVDEIEGKLTAFNERKEEVREKIIDLQNYLAVLENSGIDIGETWELYDMLASKFENDDHEDIERIIEKIKESGEIWKEYDKSLIALLNTRKELSDLKNKGIDISLLEDRFRETQELLRERKYNELITEIEIIREEADKKLIEYRGNEARREIKESEEILAQAKAGGEDIGDADEVLAEGLKALDQGDFTLALEKSIEIKERIYPFYYISVMARLKGLMVDAQDDEIDIEGYREDIIKSQALAEKGEYSSSVDILNKTETDINDAIQHKHCVQAIMEARDEMRKMADDGYDMSEAHETMLMARNELEANNYEAVQSIIGKTREMCEEIVRKGAFTAFLDRIRESIEELKDVGMDVSRYEAVLEDIGIPDEEGENEAKEKLEGISAEIDDLREEYPAVITLIQRAQYYISKMADYGCNTDEVDALFDELTGSFERREMDQAEGLGKKCVTLSEKSLEDYVSATTLLKEAGELMENVRAIGGDTKKLEENNENAIAAVNEGRYGEGLELANICLEETKNLKRNFQKMLGAIQVTQSKINMARNLGASVEEPLEFFKLIKTALDENRLDDVNRNIKLAQESADGISSGYKRMIEHVQKAQEMIFSLKGRGAVLKRAEKIFNDIIPCMDENDFDRAIELANGAVRESEHVEQKYDYLMELIGIAQNRMTEARQRGTNVTHVLASFKKVGRLMDEGDYELAQKEADGVLDTIENLTKLHNEAIRLLRLTWAKLSDAKAIGTDSSEAEGMLEEARNTIKDGEYQKAIELAKESASNLMEKLVSI